MSVNPGDPATTLDGLIEEIVGDERYTSNVMEEEFPPPGAGAVTTTLTGPALVSAFAGIAAVSCVEFTNAVGSACPPNETVEPETKFVPVTVRVNAPLP